MFLACLYHSLGHFSSQVLATSLLHSMEEAYSLVRQEVQRHVTIGTEDHIEASALAI
jgi:hypothetical protein